MAIGLNEFKLSQAISVQIRTDYYVRNIKSEHTGAERPDKLFQNIKSEPHIHKMTNLTYTPSF